MVITNGTFDTDISGWIPSGTGNYDVIWEAGRARLRIYQCSNAYMEQTFVVDRDTLTFDWQTYSDNWYEDAGWNLIIGGTTVISEGLATAKSGGYSGTKTVNVSTYMGQTATIKFQVTPGTYCRNGDHANTYLWVDNVTLTNTTTGTLDIRTHDVNQNPITDAYIFIDDVIQPVLTPAIITGLSTGNHQLKLTKTGYIDTFAITNINLNQTTIEDLVLVLAIANITAIDIVISPGPYIQPSTTTATITWQNTGTLQGSFDPAIIITKFSDGTTTRMNIGINIILDTQSTTQISFTVPDLVKDTYTICPDPN